MWPGSQNGLGISAVGLFEDCVGRQITGRTTVPRARDLGEIHEKKNGATLDWFELFGQFEPTILVSLVLFGRHGHRALP
jgi:hypothetical protein